MTVYNTMFIEKHYVSGNLDKWVRFFPNFKVQIEMYNPTHLYWRGKGSALVVTKFTEEWVYLSHKALGSETEYRIARADYDRLLEKYYKKVKV